MCHVKQVNLSQSEPTLGAAYEVKIEKEILNVVAAGLGEMGNIGGFAEC